MAPSSEPLASHTAQFMQYVTGYWITQILGTLVRLEVVEQLAGGPRSCDDVARVLGLEVPPLCRLLRGAVTAGMLVEAPPRTFALTPLGEALRKGMPGSMRGLALAMSSPGHWLPWGQLAEAVRTGKPRTHETLGTDLWGWLSRDPVLTEEFAEAMGNLSDEVGVEVATLHDFSGHARVADIGGSQGVLLGHVLKAHSGCRGILFDLPAVIPSARARLDAQGLADRVELVGGDFFAPGLPAAETYLLKFILHDWPDDQASRILQRIHESAPSGARLLVLEQVLPDDGSPSFASLLDLNMLVMAGGRERTVDEFRALFAATGWTLEGIMPSRTGMSLIEARRGP
ncbi:SAM-dependent methyltransferase [Corallococcus praedator]|uniref:SAM-dependent methyltransferase n=1 Tax=Corallococcus praedator TaxID=2316724 RepID=A0ABX9Q806_9BACT|nr:MULTISPECIES: methyltransferase [Corallococcus]RKH03834.1 SAM-dependent methyltransferase [Corallococcus sp. CA047B]RKH21941.1 SAM-dependent methyltransferase [Corallococcus sp. CA031C]RKH94464.1 SAM-dependent methyltransferase [Corallococcus praedator]